MRILLVFPPQGHFTQPYLALPSLKAWLGQNGYDDVHLMDANIEAYEWFLSPGRLTESLRRIEETGRLTELERRANLGYSDLVEYRRLTQVVTAGNWVVDGIEAAKSVMRDPERFYDYDAYVRAARCIEQGLSIISAEHHPSDLSAHGFSMRYSVQRSDDIFAGAADEAENPFLEFFREVTMPKIRELDPDVIGLSVTFTSQAIPTASLSTMIKAWKPEAHVVWGGGLLAYVGPKLVHRPDLFDVADELVLLEGERPMLRILENVERGAGRDEYAAITNIMYRDDAGVVQRTPEEEPLPIDSLPTPDFEGLPIDLYLSPEFVIPLSITRGCYWGRCVFCTLHKVIGPGYRGRSIERIVDDVRTLKERWGSRRFYFPIEDLPPNMIRKLPQAFLDAGLDIDWWCDAKLEPEAFTPETCAKLVESGCKRLAFGYESASQRVLDLMCKGSEIGPGTEVIRRVHDAGISVTLYVMVGFPTETEAEARLTLDTLVANRAYFEEASVRVFYLDYISDVFKKPDQFDVTEIRHEEGCDLQVYYDFETKSGMSRVRARQVYLDMLARLKSSLPVFQNTNVLYHELKSHYFLWLVRAGGVRPLLEGPFRRPDPGATLRLDHPQLVPGLLTRITRFDRHEVDAAVELAQDGLCLPRYQFDLITGEEAARLDRTVPVVGPRESVLVVNPQDGEVASISPDGMDLLRTCDGSRRPAEILAGLGEETAEAAQEFLDHITRAGLLVEGTREEVTA